MVKRCRAAGLALVLAAMAASVAVSGAARGESPTAPAAVDADRWLTAATVEKPTPGVSTPLPPAVDLGIPNIRQQTKVWCWAAVAQQIIHRSRGRSPRQCALVASAQGRRARDCCPGRPACVEEGTLAQIRGLIRRFGGLATEVIGPLDADSLYLLLRAGRPLILALRHSARSGHVVVLTGLSWRHRGGALEAILHINDPIGSFPPRLPLRKLRNRWHATIVVTR